MVAFVQFHENSAPTFIVNKLIDFYFYILLSQHIILYVHRLILGEISLPSNDPYSHNKKYKFQRFSEPERFIADTSGSITVLSKCSTKFISHFQLFHD